MKSKKILILSTVVLISSVITYTSINHEVLNAKADLEYGGSLPWDYSFGHQYNFHGYGYANVSNRAGIDYLRFQQTVTQYYCIFDEFTYLDTPFQMTIIANRSYWDSHVVLEMPSGEAPYYRLLGSGFDGGGSAGVFTNLNQMTISFDYKPNSTHYIGFRLDQEESGYRGGDLYTIQKFKNTIVDNTTTYSLFQSGYHLIEFGVTTKISMPFNTDFDRIYLKSFSDLPFPSSSYTDYAQGYNQGQTDAYAQAQTYWYNKGVTDGMNMTNQQIAQEAYNQGATDSFLAGIQKWIVPAIIIVILVGGATAFIQMKRKEN